ncbi:MAG: hypothetical protein KF726_00800 [Anaerolineae bacterium]|nr:hypothetical protein [Anaerolineae bacterium]
MSLIVAVCYPVGAQEQKQSPWAAAQSVHDTLFAAQKALITNAPTTALSAIESARQTYQSNLQASIVAVSPQIDALIAQGLDGMVAATNVGNVSLFASLRNQTHTRILNGAYWVVIKAVERSDVETARMWLLLREYRTTTRFLRPDADATMELKTFSEGNSSPLETIGVIKADLLDTYQAQLSKAMADTDVAAQNNFPTKLAEQAGLVAGYFEILAPAYEEQNGVDAFASMGALYNDLLTAAVNNNRAALEQSLTNIRTAMRTFRAAPLPGPEQAVRAQQIDHFIGLAAIEYGLGVRDGKIVLDFEVQEARASLLAATTAFTDIENILYARGADLTEQIEKLLRQMDTQIRNVDEPSTVSATAAQIKDALAILLPAEFIQRLNSTSNLDVINTFLSQMQLAVEAGEYVAAESARAQAYQLTDARLLQGIRGYLPDLARQVELLFWQGEQSSDPGLAAQLASRVDASTISAKVQQIHGMLSKIELMLEVNPTGHKALIVALVALIAAIVTAIPKLWRRSGPLSILRAVLIAIVGVIGVGVLVRDMQIAGTLPITPVYGLNLPLPLAELTAIFPTLQGMLPQLVVIILVYLASIISTRLSRT